MPDRWDVQTVSEGISSSLMIVTAENHDRTSHTVVEETEALLGVNACYP